MQGTAEKLGLQISHCLLCTHAHGLRLDGRDNCCKTCNGTFALCGLQFSAFLNSTNKSETWFILEEGGGEGRNNNTSSEIMQSIFFLMDGF